MPLSYFPSCSLSTHYVYLSGLSEHSEQDADWEGMHCSPLLTLAGQRTEWFINSARQARVAYLSELNIGTIRELAAYGTFFGYSFANFEQFPSNSMAFLTLALLGLLAALHKWSIMRYFKNEVTDTFTTEKAFENRTDLRIYLNLPHFNHTLFSQSKMRTCLHIHLMKGLFSEAYFLFKHRHKMASTKDSTPSGYYS